MCGLVGVAGDISVKHEQVFKDMLVMDSLRGQHSVGMAACSHASGVDVFKKAVSPVDFFTMQGFKEIMRWKTTALIGHNRYATQGAINGVNAHPFEFSEVVGAHNGTLRNQTLLPDHKDFEVDSENIYHSINQMGIEATHKRLDGAYALTYWDKTGDTLHFIRNDERPLFFTATPDKKTMFWASEDWMLYGALGRNGIKHGEIHSVEVHHLYTFNFDKIRQKDGEIELEAKKLEPYIKPYVAPTNMGPYPIGSTIKFKFVHLQPAYPHTVEGFALDNRSVTIKGYQVEDAIGATARSGTDQTFQATVRNSYQAVNGLRTVVINEKTVKPVEVVQPDNNDNGKIYTITGKSLTKKQFELATGGVCGWCSSPVESTDEGLYLFNDGTGCICKDCQGFAEVKDFMNQENDNETYYRM